MNCVTIGLKTCFGVITDSQQSRRKLVFVPDAERSPVEVEYLKSTVVAISHEEFLSEVIDAKTVRNEE